MFGDGTAVIEVGFDLATPADVERAATTLRGLTSVESVEAPTQAGGGWRVHVRPADHEGRVRQDILVAAVAEGLHLTALRPIVPSLDDIYRVAVERPIPKRTGVKAKGRRRREAMAAAAAAAAGAGPTEPDVLDDASSLDESAEEGA